MNHIALRSLPGFVAANQGQRFVANSFDFDQQVRIRQLVDGHRCACWAIKSKVLAINLVVSFEVVHAGKERRDFYKIIQLGSFTAKNIGDVFDDRSRLSANVEIGSAHRINGRTFKAVVRAPGRSAGKEQKIAGTFDVRELPTWRRLAGKDRCLSCHERSGMHVRAEIQALGVASLEGFTGIADHARHGDE